MENHQIISDKKENTWSFLKGAPLVERLFHGVSTGARNFLTTLSPILARLTWTVQ